MMDRVLCTNCGGYREHDIRTGEVGSCDTCDAHDSYVESLAAKLPTNIWATDADMSAGEFHASYVRNNGPLFLYNVRRVTVREAYAIRPDVYDKTVRCGGIAPGTNLYWYAAEYTNEPI